MRFYIKIRKLFHAAGLGKSPLPLWTRSMGASYRVPQILQMDLTRQEKKRIMQLRGLAA